MTEQATQSSTKSVPIESIAIRSRYRKELGDIDALAASIEACGLLHPPVVTGELDLVCGFRRIEAAKRLGWSEIEVRLIDFDDPLKAEHDENEARKPFTVSERVAIARAIEESIGRRAGQRTDLMEPRQNFAEVQPGRRTRDTAAKRAGFGNRETYRQAEKVVDDGAPGLVEAMDRGDVKPSVAAVLADLPKEQQAEVVSKGPSAIKDKVADIKVEQALEKLAEDIAPEADWHPDTSDVGHVPFPGQGSLFGDEADDGSRSAPAGEMAEEERELKLDRFNRRHNQILSYAAALRGIKKADAKCYKWTPKQRKALAHSLICIRKNLDYAIAYLKGAKG